MKKEVEEGIKRPIDSTELDSRDHWKELTDRQFKAAVLVATWHFPPELGGSWDLGPRKGAEKLIEIVASTCDITMSRFRPPRARWSAYWWTEDIAELRRATIHAWCLHTRARRAQAHGEYTRTNEGYREARNAFKVAIGKAKLAFIEGVLNALFPHVGEALPQIPIPELRDGSWNDGLQVEEWEVAEARKQLRAKGKVPGPDEISGRVWALALADESLSVSMRHAFTACLREGIFLPAWKRPKLVLLPKEGRAFGTTSAYWPIYLLDEAGKLLERVIANRLVRHLATEGPDLHGN
ncbi:uncharacterized protein LOC105190406 [Harpegnathos saltator]|uniref:uncharacterized protein LOC105190406 n=1 Tax=Harpegnathos saltator TaxID=610380 RepID=UPI0005901CFD|nr:uncharacterized protein LOC105190406 [Harpegnathos saltator]